MLIVTIPRHATGLRCYDAMPKMLPCYAATVTLMLLLLSLDAVTLTPLMPAISATC